MFDWRLSTAVMVLAAAVTAGCVSSGPQAEDAPRGPIGLTEVRIHDDGSRLSVGVDSCNGSPEVRDVRESTESVRITVVSEIQTGVRDGCLDGVEVGLDEPLGGRTVIDGTTGETVEVDQESR